MKYQLTINSFGQQNGVKRTDDTGNIWYIPFDSANTDFQQYQLWLSEGNVPEPADEPTLP